MSTAIMLKLPHTELRKRRVQGIPITETG